MNLDLNAINLSNIWFIMITFLMFGAFIWRGKVGGINASIQGLGQDVICLIVSVIVAVLPSVITEVLLDTGHMVYDWMLSKSTNVSVDEAQAVHDRIFLFWTCFLTGRYMWDQLWDILKQGLKEASNRP